MSKFKFIQLYLFCFLFLQGYSYCSVPDEYYLNKKTKQYTKLPENCIAVNYNGTEYYCQICKANFDLKDKQCQALKISKCKEGIINENGTEQCNICESGFHPSIDKLSCDSDPSQDQTGRYKRNCQKYEYNDNILECAECDSGVSYLWEGNCNDNPKEDSPFDYIAGCQKYRYISSQVGFQCEYCNVQRTQGVKEGERECVDLPLLDANIRKIQKDNAHQIYDCREGYFVNDSGYRCEGNPSSDLEKGYDANCSKYIWVGHPSCQKCKNGWIKDGDQCIEIPNEQAIANCQEYSKQSFEYPQIQCNQCEKGYWFGEITDRGTICEQCPAVITGSPSHSPVTVINKPGQPSQDGILMFRVFIIIIIINLLFI